MLQVLVSNPLSFVIYAVALVIALSWHEAAHALVAKQLGDSTAEDMGRLTLNPLAHLDPIGTIAILIAGIGWGKPVPVNPYNFANPKVGNLLVALAGPFSNLILAVIFALLFQIFRPDPGSLAGIFTAIIIRFNLLLMFFNLIPIPPLDGSKIIHLFMEDEAFFRFEQYGFYLLFGLIILDMAGFPILSSLVVQPAQALFHLITGGSFAAILS